MREIAHVHLKNLWANLFSLNKCAFSLREIPDFNSRICLNDNLSTFAVMQLIFGSAF